MNKFLGLLLLLLLNSNFLFSNTTSPQNPLFKYNNAQNDSIRVQALREIINYWSPQNADSTIHYSKLIIKEAKAIKNISLTYKGYYWVVNLYGQVSQQDSALHYAFEGLAFFEKYDQSFYQSVLLILTGEQFRALSKFDKALYFLEKAWKTSKNAANDELLTGIANRIAAVYHETDQLDQALLWADSSLLLGEQMNNSNYRLNSLITKGAVKKDKGDYTEALKIFREALPLAVQSNNLLDHISILNNMANTYRHIKNYRKVIEIAEESFRLSEENKIKALSIVSSENLADAYFQLKEFKKAFEYLSIYEKLRNEIFFEERDAKIFELNTKYEIREKEQQIDIQKISLLKKELEILQNKRNSFLLILAVVLLMGFAAYRYKVYRKTEQVNAQLTEKNTKINQQKIEIETYADKVEAAYKRLQKLDEYKQAVTNMLVHDLKNPLNTLVNIEHFEDEKEKTELVKHTGKQMLNLIMNLLDINKAENNQMILEKTNSSLYDILQASIKDVEFLCQQKNIKIICTSSNNYRLNADVELIKRVFNNLLTNAIKFSPTNEIVFIETKVIDKNLVRVVIKDKGPGIASKYHKIIFEQFKQVKKVKSSEAFSTGLGLAFCKMAVESHNWTIGIESEPGQGAEFWVLISDAHTIEADSMISENRDNSEIITDNIILSQKDKEMLEPLLRELIRNNVYAVSHIKEILSSIRKMNIEQINPWLGQVQLAMETLNEEKFMFLIKSLLL